MIKLLWQTIKFFLPLLPFVLFALLNMKANLKKELRSRQYLMPVFALVYCILLMALISPINKLLFRILRAIPDALAAAGAWMSTILEGKLAGFGGLLNGLGEKVETALLKVNPVYILFYVENALFLLAHILLKRILLAFLKRICTPGKPLHEKIAGLFYDHEEGTEDWFIKKNMGQARTFLRWAYIGALVTAVAASVASMWLFRTGWLSSLFFPVFGVIIIGELSFFLGGLTRKEMEPEFEAEKSDLVKGIDFRGMRDALRRLFGDKLTAEDTLVRTEDSELRSNEELIADLENSEDPMLEAYGRFMRRKLSKGLDLDQNYLNTGRELLCGRSILYNNPFYYDLIPYIFYPLNRTLLRHRKVLIVLGRHETEQDVEAWCREGLCEVTGLQTMWQLGVLGKSEKDLDVGIITRSDVHNLDLHEANRDFFAKVEFVVLMEPSRLVTTAQVGLNSLVRHCRAGDKQVTYCSMDKNCDGLVDSLSHILMANLTEVSATNRPKGLSSYMCWTPDDDMLQHRMLPNIARYLGVGTELAFTGLKNQAPRADWFGGDAFPVTDIHWIARQYYYDLLSYANKPPVQEGMDEYFRTTHNLWSARAEEDHYMIVEDESNNMFEVRRNFSTRAREQGFVNVVSQAYLLRDYMAENRGLFNTDPKAIPYIVADYARTERNVALRLCLRMAADRVPEEEIRRELMLVNQDSAHPLQSFWHMLCASWYSGQIPVNPDGEEVLELDCGGERYRFTSAVVERSRKYSIETGRVENTYQIRNRQYVDTVLLDLQNAGYIAEDEQGAQQYLGTELRGQIFQKYLPGQFFSLGGKYYQMLRLTSDGRILVRRAADHITGRPCYRQVRRYTLSSLRDSELMGDRLNVSGMKILKQFADIRVETSAYWDMPDYNDFTAGKRVDVNGVPERAYRCKQVLRVELPAHLNPTPAIYRTTALLINEVFRTLFAENQDFICAVVPGEAEAPLTYSLDLPDEGPCLYFIEDSQLDIGLLEAVRRNLNRIFAILCDYLSWHTETLEADLNPPAPTSPVPAAGGETDGGAAGAGGAGEPEEKKGFFRRAAQRIKGFFRRLFHRRRPEEKQGEAPADGEELPADPKARRAAKKARKKAEKEARKAAKAAAKAAKQEAKRRKKQGLPPEEAEVPTAGRPGAPEESVPEAPQAGPQESGAAQPSESIPPESDAPSEPEASDDNAFFSLFSLSDGEAPTEAGSGETEPDAPASRPGGEAAPVSVSGSGPDTLEFEPESASAPADSLTRKPYHERYYLLYGGSEVPASLDVAGTLEFLKALGFEKSPLTQARVNKGIAELIEKSFVPDRAGSHYCDFCGCELIGTNYERLKDGRERCLPCGKTAVRTAEEFQKLYREVHRNLETFYGAKITVPIRVQMVNAKKVHKATNKTFIPTGGKDGRVLGVAIQSRKGYEILIENGSPRLKSIMTMAHELTHIWQYTNWDAKQILKSYGKQQRLEVYEGMAKWSEIQYAYLIGETATAKRQEIITRHRTDEYGRGFVRYAEKYPLSESTSLGGRLTPFTDREKPL